MLHLCSTNLRLSLKQVLTRVFEYKNLREYNVLIDYLTDSRMSELGYFGLQSFIDAGGGYVGLHCAANLTLTTDGRLDEPIPEMVELIGGYFVDHSESSRFEVSLTDSTHPVLHGVTDFTIFDEPYLVRCNEGQVLAQINHLQIPDTPVLWTRKIGKGRICYCSIGHTDEAFRIQEFQRILVNSVYWAGQLA